MGHERRDVDLTRVVEVLQKADSADGLEHLRHLLSPDVVLHTCDVVVIGAEAVVTALQRWVAIHGTGWEVADVVNGGDRLAVRFLCDGRQGALFLTADDDGRVVAATVTPSAA